MQNFTLTWFCACVGFNRNACEMMPSRTCLNNQPKNYRQNFSKQVERRIGSKRSSRSRVSVRYVPPSSIRCVAAPMGRTSLYREEPPETKKTPIFLSFYLIGVGRQQGQQVMSGGHRMRCVLQEKSNFVTALPHKRKNTTCLPFGQCCNFWNCVLNSHEFEWMCIDLIAL